MSKIIDIIFKPTLYKYKKPFHITGSISYEAKNLEVIIKTESGVEGYGEVSPSWRVNGESIDIIIPLEKRVREVLIGEDVRNWRKILEIIDTFKSTPGLKTALGFATIDAFCVECEIGVWEFFGGYTDNIETDKTVSIGEVDEMVEDAIRINKEGFRKIKIKVGENLLKDIEAVYKISKKTKAEYIVDANMGYSPKEAVYFAKKLYSLGIDISLFEQPVNFLDIEGLKYVRYNSPYPVCADESLKTRYDAKKLAKEEAVDFFNIKLGKSGISDALSIVEIAKSFNIGLMIGCFSESSIGVNQSVHFACGVGGFKYCDLDSHLMLDEKKYRGKFLQKKNKIFVRK
jgi:L-alanine-DL-glutamate epimerase-like enolase superfamily enzyme